MTMSVGDAEGPHFQGGLGMFATDQGADGAQFFEAVGNRCAFVPKWSPAIRESIRLAAVLKRAGLAVRQVDPVDELEALIARPWQADLHLKVRSSERAAQWAYGRKGVRIPRSALGQLGCGEAIDVSEVERGDLVFARASGVTYLLGLATGDGAVIGVPRTGVGAVAEIPAVELSECEALLARRLIGRHLTVLTVVSRSESEIFDSRDIDRLLFRLDL